MASAAGKFSGGQTTEQDEDGEQRNPWYLSLTRQNHDFERWGDRDMKPKAIALCLLAAGVFACSPTDDATRESAPTPPTPPIITTADAILYARHVCEGTIEVPAETEAIVTETNDSFVVTFPQPVQPDILHGDIYAQVTFEKETGKVTDMLVGP